MKIVNSFLFTILLFVIYSCEEDVSPPVADFTASTTEIEEGETITFTDQSTNSPTFWGWDFGDGGTSSEQNPSYTYNALGEYTVTLTVSNNGGLDNETKPNFVTVNAAGIAPNARFTADSDTVTLGTAISFTDQSTNSPTTWSWDFGDGNTSSEQNPSYTYDSVGHFTVILVASNDYGSDNETKRNYITITHDYGSMTDIERNIYKTIQIGDQVWMAENLKVTHYPDSTEIPFFQNFENWEQLNYSDDVYCWYDNDPSIKDSHGAIYTWAASMNGELSSNSIPSGIQGVCPEGWHLPSNEEWIILEINLGMSSSIAELRGFRGTNEASKISGDEYLWMDGALKEDPEFGSSGFNASPSGSNGGGVNYWSSTQTTSADALRRRLDYDKTQISHHYGDKRIPRAVRCIKN